MIDHVIDHIGLLMKPAQHDTCITPRLITKDNVNEAERIAEIK